jgi:hypothetical protein
VDRTFDLPWFRKSVLTVEMIFALVGIAQWLQKVSEIPGYRGSFICRSTLQRAAATIQTTLAVSLQSLPTNRSCGFV